MFKESFKYYKAKCPIPDFSEVVDELPSVSLCELNLGADHFAHLGLPLGLTPVHTWRCFSLKQHPGLILIRNPFTAQGQRYWIARSLRDYPRKPNIVNLNARLFSPSVLEDWWRELQQCTDNDEARRMKISMRWSTLGYHHDWDTKIYKETMRAEFPADLSKISNFFAEVLGFERFTAQAAIVNFYPIGTTLSAHTDHSEMNLDAPLFSFSFGQSAIFLIGGRTKEDKPTALYLKSGDVLVMSGESRLCYHAVPRIMKAFKENWNEFIDTKCENSVDLPNCKKLRIECNKNMPSEWQMDLLLYQQVANEDFWAPYKMYLNDSRININVRQVLNEGVTKLDLDNS